jgi:serine/threonine protein kinase
VTVTTRHIVDHILCPLCRAPNRPDARFCQQCGKDVLLDDVYRITRVLKEGGMGVVYQAVDSDGALYAIKELHDRFTDQHEREEGIRRFLDEAKVLRALRGHPAIPRVYRSFLDEGRYYLSMEFIFGVDLEDLLRRHGRFPETQVLQWADQLCDVLEHLHANGLIYRDMKPSNIMITYDGNVKVIDFGIAQLLQPDRRGTTIGTPGYAPPEQYQGITTPQSDVYALAATLHHLMTGRDPRPEPPFAFPPARSLNPQVSLSTSRALEKALQMEPADRYPTVAAFRRALPVPTGNRYPTRPFDRMSQPQRQPRRQAAIPPFQSQPPASVQPQRQPRSQVRQGTAPWQRTRRQRAIRRIIATSLLAAGLVFGASQWGPTITTLVQSYIEEQLPEWQEYLPEWQEYLPNLNNQAPTEFIPQLFT